MSGTRADRAEFQRMFEHARLKHFNMVLFWALDRFSREGTLKTLEHLQRLDSYGVAWKSFTEQYLDSTGMFRDAVIAILATIAKQEHARLSERVVAGLRRAKREGKVLGRKRIILDREKIRTMHASGQSVRVIAAELGVSKSLVANILNGSTHSLNRLNIPPSKAVIGGWQTPTVFCHTIR
jgi:DNA invertase Pin-like site-specific DNA recombinase